MDRVGLRRREQAGVVFRRQWQRRDPLLDTAGIDDHRLRTTAGPAFGATGRGAPASLTWARAGRRAFEGTGLRVGFADDGKHRGRQTLSQ